MVCICIQQHSVVCIFKSHVSFDNWKMVCWNNSVQSDSQRSSKAEELAFPRCLDGNSLVCIFLGYFDFWTRLLLQRWSGKYPSGDFNYIHGVQSDSLVPAASVHCIQTKSVLRHSVQRDDAFVIYNGNSRADTYMAFVSKSI